MAAEVLANDLDADGDALSLVGTPTCDDDALTLSVRANRVMAVLPQTEGLYMVRYTVTDSRGGTDVGTLTIQVTAQAPPISRGTVFLIYLVNHNDRLELHFDCFLEYEACLGHRSLKSIY